MNAVAESFQHALGRLWPGPNKAAKDAEIGVNEDLGAELIARQRVEVMDVSLRSS